MIQVRAEFTLDAGDELTWCYDPNDDFSDVFEKYTRLLCSHSRLAHAHRLALTHTPVSYTHLTLPTILRV